MTRDDYLWIGIRLFGVFLLVSAIISGVTAIAAVIEWQQSGWMRAAEIDTVRDLGRTIHARSLVAMPVHASACLFKLLAAAYFLRAGRIIFAMISPPSIKPVDTAS